VLRRLLGFLILCVTVLVARPSVAETQEQQAAALEKEGRDAFSAGEFAAAAGKFDSANRLAPHAQLRFNAALAWERAREPARAADAYEGALRQGGLDAQREKRAEAALGGLKETLGYVKVPRPVSGTLTVAHLNHAPIPAQFHLSPGRYELAIEGADGAKTSKTVVVKAGEVVSVDVQMESVEPGAAIPRRVAEPSTPGDEPPPVDDTPTSSSSKKTWGWIAIGAGVVSGGVATYFGTQTTKAKSDYEDSGFTDADARDRGVRNRLITNVALGGALVGVGVGSYLLLTSGSKSSTQGRQKTRFAIAVRGPRLDARLEF
jgi:hypothetical protein